MPFPQTKSFSFTENFSKCTQKPLFFAQKLSFCTSLAILKSQPFLQTKSFLSAQAFPYRPQKQPFSATNTANFRPAITYCPPKNTAVLFLTALTPYAVTPERRTDSKPFRRRFVRKTGFGSCRRKLLRKHFRQSFESSPESRGSQTSGVLLVLFVHAKSTKNVPFAGSSEVLQTSNQPTVAAASHRNN